MNTMKQEGQSAQGGDRNKSQEQSSRLDRAIDYVWGGIMNARAQLYHEVVTRGFYGREFDHAGDHQHADRGYVWGPPQKEQGSTDRGDPLGRTAPEAEGPLSSEDRVMIHEAFDRHRETGPVGSMEMENYWNDMERMGRTSDGLDAYDRILDEPVNGLEADRNHDDLER